MLTQALSAAVNSYDVPTPTNGGGLLFLLAFATLLATRKGWQR